MMNDEQQQLVDEIVLDLDVLILLRRRCFTPKVRGILAASKIDRAVRGWYEVRTAL